MTSMPRDAIRNAPQNPRFNTNSEIAIQVPDLERAEAFYAGVLGLRVVARGDAHIEIDSGALRLYVNRDDTPRSYIPSFDVPDYDAARRHLEASGCRTVSAGDHSSAVYFEDPFGFVFDIIERH